MSKEPGYTPDQGFVAEYDIKDDEEQNVKLQQTVELLLSAGYFRARIKGLSPFDKVVGGMTWCITTCNYDVDVDLLFQENSTIGQKIALTEKIVSVLPRMKCPHRIEPHQIQGLDFIHIFPVVQWLVMKAIETREETGDYIRAYSVSQFDKHYSLPQEKEQSQARDTAVKILDTVKSCYQPERKYKRHDASKLTAEETRVQSTLLEYGKTFGTVLQESDQSKNDRKEEDPKDFLQQQEEEEKKITALMTGMSLTSRKGSKLTARAVGSIVGMQSEQIQEVAEKYAEKQAELEKQEKESPRFGGAHHHIRLTTSIQKQTEQMGAKLKELVKIYSNLEEDANDVQKKLDEAEQHCASIDAGMHRLAEIESEADQDKLKQLRDLVAMSEHLKKQEQDFRNQCKEEMESLQADLNEVKRQTGVDNMDNEQTKLINKQLEADKEKLNKIRILLARKNRDISSLQRKIDEVPTRAELSQYQRRFVELYNQIATKHKETKQFYTLYNTLDDTKLYLNKEANLLNSVHDTFGEAMASQASKDQFLKQFEQIVEGVKNNLYKLERKKQEEKMRRDQLNDHYLDLVDKRRVYFKTVKDFQEECRKNEILRDKLNIKHHEQ